MGDVALRAVVNEFCDRDWLMAHGYTEPTPEWLEYEERLRNASPGDAVMIGTQRGTIVLIQSDRIIARLGDNVISKDGGVFDIAEVRAYRRDTGADWHDVNRPRIAFPEN